MKQLLSEQTYKLLTGWADIDAGKENPATHDLDEQRWLKFVIAAFRENAPHKEVISKLPGWLKKQNEKWIDESAESMAGKYEYSIAVLNAFVQSEKESAE